MQKQKKYSLVCVRKPKAVSTKLLIFDKCKFPMDNKS